MGAQTDLQRCSCNVQRCTDCLSVGGSRRRSGKAPSDS